VPIDIVAGEVGEAARLKLLRSVFMKGLATLVIEGLEAARATGAEAWMRQQIAAELGPGGHTMIDHLLAGTYLHSERREHEVRDALATLEGVDAAADMTRATLAWFERLNGLRS
jgi:3-hydroxyisobutyrate dehydrogenase-like beta-hydroxyacid dehydrogenase